MINTYRNVIPKVKGLKSLFFNDLSVSYNRAVFNCYLVITIVLLNNIINRLFNYFLLLMQFISPLYGET